MSTFKTALRMALAHPFYLLIYTVFISLMGFTIIYLILAAAALYAAVRFIRRTPAADDRRDA